MTSPGPDSVMMQLSTFYLARLLAVAATAVSVSAQSDVCNSHQHCRDVYGEQLGEMGPGYDVYCEDMNSGQSYCRVIYAATSGYSNYDSTVYVPTTESGGIDGRTIGSISGGSFGGSFGEGGGNGGGGGGDGGDGGGDAALLAGLLASAGGSSAGHADVNYWILAAVGTVGFWTIVLIVGQRPGSAEVKGLFKMVIASSLGLATICAVAAVAHDSIYRMSMDEVKFTIDEGLWGTTAGECMFFARLGGVWQVRVGAGCFATTAEL